MRSVILIGGGEPTLYPGFEEVVSLLKSRGADVAVVTNGSNMQKVGQIAHLFGEKDWLRLSLDSGTNETFRAMHRPHAAISLEQICQDVKSLKQHHPNVVIGFSYVITWEGVNIKGREITPNINEIAIAARLAREHGFNFFSIKPILERDPSSAEVVGIPSKFSETIEKIGTAIRVARELETDNFRVLVSSNLRALKDDSLEAYKDQPENCHMTHFRNVLSPFGLFNCPACRGMEGASFGGKDSYAGDQNYGATMVQRARHIHSFNAKLKCRDVTCLYSPTNKYIEELIRHKGVSELKPSEEKGDYFL